MAMLAFRLDLRFDERVGRLVRKPNQAFGGVQGFRHHHARTWWTVRSMRLAHAHIGGCSDPAVHVRLLTAPVLKGVLKNAQSKLTV